MVPRTQEKALLNFEPGNRLRTLIHLIADRMIVRDYAQRPGLLDRYGEAGKTEYRKSVSHDLAALAAAVDAGDAGIFIRHVAWLKILRIHHGVASEDVVEGLRCMAAVLVDNAHTYASSCVQVALAQYDSMPSTTASFIDPLNEDHTLARQTLDALLDLKGSVARNILERAIAAGMPPARIYTEILPPLMREIGRLWQTNKISVVHEHYCSAAVQSMVGGLDSLLFDNPTPTQVFDTILGSRLTSGRWMIVACVEGERHELGARIIAEIFRLNGWRTSFLGADSPARDLMSLIRQAHRPPDLIALSATMPDHLVHMASTIQAIRDESDIPIIVGGTLFNEIPSVASRLGADGCVDSAAAALAVASALVSPVSCN
jgi:methanogenic corrinoid protein MtbC1